MRICLQRFHNNGAKLLEESLDDHVAVGNLFSVELDEGQQTLLGAMLALMIHILQNEIIERIERIL